MLNVSLSEMELALILEPSNDNTDAISIACINRLSNTTAS